MSTLTTINATDLITDSRTDINSNFTALNTDKIETSYLDTDTAMAANSDVKIPSQKAVKTYIDTSGGSNASETVRGIVEEATDAEVTAGTATGATGAKLVVTPAKLATRLGTTIADVTALNTAKTYTIGALDNSTVKTYFNIQFPFTLWTGSSSGAATTDFPNWVRSSTDAFITPGGAMLDYRGTGQDTIILGSEFLLTGASTDLAFDSTNVVIIDFWAKLPSSGTGDLNMGFCNGVNSIDEVYNSSTEDRVTFTQRGSTGVLYATISKGGTGVTNTDISSGLTLTNWNNYRIEFDIGNEAKFYVNGTLKATLSGANLYTGTGGVNLGFGRSDTILFQATAPNISLQMNP